MNTTQINAKTLVSGRKLVSVPATKKICIMVDGVEDAALSYTVPEGKTANLMVSITGNVA